MCNHCNQEPRRFPCPVCRKIYNRSPLDPTPIDFYWVDDYPQNDMLWLVELLAISFFSAVPFIALLLVIV